MYDAKRQDQESFKAYKQRLYKEKIKLKKYLKGKWFWISTIQGTLKKDKKGNCIDKYGKISKGLC